MPLPGAAVAIAGKRLTFKLSGGQGVEFTASFNSDGTVTHSHRPDGTWVAAGLVVTVTDEEEVTLTFPKAAIEVGDVFSANPESLQFEVTTVAQS